eukprot:11775104-Alexandrium_andersonii.AAC.1
MSFNVPFGTPALEFGVAAQPWGRSRPSANEVLEHPVASYGAHWKVRIRQQLASGPAGFYRPAEGSPTHASSYPRCKHTCFVRGVRPQSRCVPQDR